MKQGTVKFFNTTKGYGFITPEDGGKEIFVHKSGCKEDIKERDVVNYDERDGKKGIEAHNVSLA